MDHDLLSPLRDRDAIDEPDWQAMERRLLEACAAAKGSRRAPAVVAARDWRGWIAAAAAVVMAAAITFYTTPHRTVTPGPASRPPAAPSSPAAATKPEPARLDGAKETAAPTPPPPRVRATTPATPLRTEASGHEFVPLPGAFALPDLESGRIVRIEVPIAGLPAFGIDLVPDAAPAAVEADFLIGQDGLPRAIRLASTRVP